VRGRANEAVPNRRPSFLVTNLRYTRPVWQIESTDSLGRIAVPPFVPDGFALFCTTADFDGRLTGDHAGLVTTVVRERFGVSSVLATCTQVHGINVHRAVRAEGWRECDSCDALWSPERNVALGIKIADCLPVAMLDPTHEVIGNAHSGWRGAVQGVTAATIDAITQATSFDPASSFAYLGPSIRGCCFEVGDEVAAQFEERYVDRSHGRPHVDLVAFTRDILRRRGFVDERVYDSELCTRCEGSLFHSYRRNGAGGGRNLQIAAM
jgi:polyphenol oxidase